MKNNEHSESDDSEDQNEIDDSDDYSDIDSDRPNLLQINKKIDKIKKEEETKLLEKKHSRNKNDTDIKYDANIFLFYIIVLLLSIGKNKN